MFKGYFVLFHGLQSGREVHIKGFHIHHLATRTKLRVGWVVVCFALVLIIAILIYRSVQPGKPVIDQKKTLSNHPTFVLANMSNYINTSRALHFHRPIFPWDTTNSGEKQRNIKKTTNYDCTSVRETVLHFESKIFLGKIQLPLVNCFFCSSLWHHLVRKVPTSQTRRYVLRITRGTPFSFSSLNKPDPGKGKEKNNNCLFFCSGGFLVFSLKIYNTYQMQTLKHIFVKCYILRMGQNLVFVRARRFDVSSPPDWDK